jgi:uncharacterized protein YheU (UPF0270 family)
MIIPIDKLSNQVLNGIIQEFVSREGTEYGDQDISVDEKVAQVTQQLQQGTALLVFSELHQSVNILPSDQFNPNDVDQA